MTETRKNLDSASPMIEPYFSGGGASIDTHRYFGVPPYSLNRDTFGAASAGHSVDPATPEGAKTWAEARARYEVPAAAL